MLTNGPFALRLRQISPAISVDNSAGSGIGNRPQGGSRRPRHRMCRVSTIRVHSFIAGSSSLPENKIAYLSAQPWEGYEHGLS